MQLHRSLLFVLALSFAATPASARGRSAARRLAIALSAQGLGATSAAPGGASGVNIVKSDAETVTEVKSATARGEVTRLFTTHHGAKGNRTVLDETAVAATGSPVFVTINSEGRQLLLRRRQAATDVTMRFEQPREPNGRFGSAQLVKLQLRQGHASRSVDFIRGTMTYLSQRKLPGQTPLSLVALPSNSGGPILYRVERKIPPRLLQRYRAYAWSQARQSRAR